MIELIKLQSSYNRIKMLSSFHPTAELHAMCVAYMIYKPLITHNRLNVRNVSFLVDLQL